MAYSLQHRLSPLLRSTATDNNEILALIAGLEKEIAARQTQVGAPSEDEFGSVLRRLLEEEVSLLANGLFPSSDSVGDFLERDLHPINLDNFEFELELAESCITESGTVAALAQEVQLPGYELLELLKLCGLPQRELSDLVSTEEKVGFLTWRRISNTLGNPM